MKFKITVIGLLTAILTVCCFTSYRLIQEAERQTTIQIAQAEANLAIGEFLEYQMRGINFPEGFGSAAEAYLDSAEDDWRKVKYPDTYGLTTEELYEKSVKEYQEAHKND